MVKIPSKLKNDAIAEAILEIRFETEFPDELVVGRLLDRQPWAEYRHTRLSLADVPGPIRKAQESMRFQPIFEARKKDRVVKVGANTISFHVLGRYPGWTVFEEELHRAIDEVFNALRTASVRRLGLRYINAVDHEDHFVSSFDDLTLKIQLRGEELAGPKNLNFITKSDADLSCTTRIASKEFIAGNPSSSFELLIDIDVYTPPEHTADSADGVKQWLERAHNFEKKCFFALFPDQMIENLMEDEG